MSVPTFRTARVVEVLASLREYARDADAAAKARVQARADELGHRVSTKEKYELYGEAPPLAVSDAVGELLYVLALAWRAERVVEFGASHGISTIYLAAALRDSGRGSLVTSEILPGKAGATARNLAAAGLDDLVEIRVGDARETLRDVSGPMDFLFLDGRNDLYLELLRMLEPALAEDAVVAADLSVDDPDLEGYLGYVRAADGAYLSSTLVSEAGLEVSVRQGPRR